MKFLLWVNWMVKVNPKDTINNEYGWSVVNIVPGSDQNAFLRVLRLIVLILTFGLFTWGDGVYVIYEKEE